VHPNDVVILSSKIFNLRKLHEEMSKFESSHCMFESYDELSVKLGMEKDYLLGLGEQDMASLIRNNKEYVESIRRSKKNHFYSNSGKIKFSTSHSFKGLESKYVIYLLDEKDSPEVIHTSITRSSESILIIDVSGKNPSSNFFKERLDGY